MNHKKMFENPDRAYTALPFWFWNDKLDEKEIIRQIHDFNDKGIHGFIIHPRKGLPRSIEYMSEVYLDFVEIAVKEACHLDMQVILYDEAQYPSGSAHGEVVRKNPDHASKGLRIEYFDTRASLENYQVDEDERLLLMQSRDDKHMAFIQCFSGGTIRGIHEDEDDHESLAPKSADLLNKAATLSFIESTHEKYYKRLSKYFGSTIIAMFTDEPKILGRCSRKDIIPWTDDLLNELISRGFKMNDMETLFDKNDLYEKTLYELMSERFYKPLYDWCEDHEIGLTGHPEGSDDIGLLKYFHIPGQDVVWRWIAPELTGVEGIHSTMAKCSADSMRHRGRSRNANEVLGCCGPDGIQWALTMDDFKWYMDYLFIRGVNMIYLHAFYYSVRSEVQFGERPPDVGPNNIWWDHMNQMSDYIKRMSWLLTDASNQAKIAVITGHKDLPYEEVKAFFEHQIEFNYLEEELLDKAIIENDKIYIENQVYDKVYIHHASDHHKALLEGLEKVTAPTHQSAFKHIRYSHIVKEGISYHLYCNEGEEKINFKTRALSNPEIWNPWTGEISGVEIINDDMVIPLERRQLLIVTSGNKGFLRHEYEDLCHLEDWTLDGKKVDLKFEEVDYSGPMVYETTFTSDASSVRLNLGSVKEMASVYLNNQLIGTSMFAPHYFDLSEHLLEGTNHLKVIVKNTMANHYGTILPSGLIGPVILEKKYEE
ncbi:hypothetical protein EZV73_05510 [Acidaminobacter sp. JC074]|uniref:glycosyl hydrolase 2 galactose-binding domain-containing protein n=1 Tax=Acidaminobacter sp. JC074 TaxID=2530199 RepID=UPI001F0E5B22|nr:hypothetical protein [Acidaminobacter sp. JC074]MCH4887014.1 hypothetical protein [Acidaminobacter sp. JC074]